MAAAAHRRPTTPAAGPSDGPEEPDIFVPRTPTRWTARRKAQVVMAVRTRLLTVEQACDRYGLSAEELAAWERHLDHHGVAGLRIGQISQQRRSAAH